MSESNTPIRPATSQWSNQPKTTPPPTLPSGESNLIFNTFGKLSDEDRKRREEMLRKMEEQKALMAMTTGEVDVEDERIYSFLDPKLFSGKEDENQALLAKGLATGGLTTKIIDGKNYVFTVDPKTGQRGDLALAEVGSNGNIQKMRYTQPTKLFGVDWLPIPGTNEGIGENVLEDINTGVLPIDKSQNWQSSPFGLDPAVQTIANLFTEEDKSRVFSGYHPKSWEEKDGTMPTNWYDVGQDFTGALTTAAATAATGGAPIVAGAASALPFVLDNVSAADRDHITPQAAAVKSALDVGSGMIGGQYVPSLSGATLGQAAKTITGMVAADVTAGAGNAIIDQTQRERQTGFTSKDASTDYLNAETGLSAVMTGIFSSVANTAPAGIGTVVGKYMNNKMKAKTPASDPTKAVVQPEDEIKKLVQQDRNPNTGQSVDNPTSLAQANEVKAMADAAVNEAQASGSRRKLGTAVDPITGKTTATYTTDEVGVTASRYVEEASNFDKALEQRIQTSPITKLGRQITDKDKIEMAIEGLKPYISDPKVGKSIAPLFANGKTTETIEVFADRFQVKGDGLKEVIDKIVDVETGRYTPSAERLENVTTEYIERVSNGSTKPDDVLMAKEEATAIYRKAENTLANKIADATGMTTEDAKKTARSIMLEASKSSNSSEATKKFVDKAHKTDPALISKKLDADIMKQLEKLDPNLTTKIVSSDYDGEYPDELIYQSSDIDVINDSNLTGVNFTGYNKGLLDVIITPIAVGDLSSPIEILKQTGLTEDQSLMVVKQLTDFYNGLDKTGGIQNVDGKKVVDWKGVNKAKDFNPDNAVKPINTGYINTHFKDVSYPVQFTGNNTDLSEAMYLLGHTETNKFVKDAIVNDIISQLNTETEVFTPAQIKAIADDFVKTIREKAAKKDNSPISIDPFLKPKESQTITITELNEKLKKEALVKAEAEKNFNKEFNAELKKEETAAKQKAREEEKAKKQAEKQAQEAEKQAKKQQKTSGNPAKPAPHKQVKVGKAIISYKSTDPASNLLFDRVMEITDATELSSIARDLAPRLDMSEERVFLAAESFLEQRRVQEIKVQEAQIVGLDEGSTPNSDGYFEFEIKNPFTPKETKAINTALVYNDNLAQFTKQSPSVKTESGRVLEFAPYAADDMPKNYMHALLNYNRDNVAPGQAPIIDQVFRNGYGLTNADITNIQRIAATDVSQQFQAAAVRNPDALPTKYALTKEAKAKIKNVMDIAKAAAKPIKDGKKQNTTGQQIAKATMPFVFLPFDEDDDSNYSIYASIPMLAVLGSKVSQRAMLNALKDGKFGSKFLSGHKFDEASIRNDITRSAAYKKAVDDAIASLMKSGVTNQSEIDAGVEIVKKKVIEEGLAKAKVLEDKTLLRGTTAQKALKGLVTQNKETPANPYWANIYNAMMEADEIAGRAIKPVSRAIGEFTEKTEKPVKDALIFGNIEAYLKYVDLANAKPTAKEASRLQRAEYDAMLDLFKDNMFKDYIFPRLQPLGNNYETSLAYWNSFRDIMDAKSLVDLNSRINHELSAINYQDYFPELGRMVSFNDLQTIKTKLTDKKKVFDDEVALRKEGIKNTEQLYKEGSLSNSEREVLLQEDESVVESINGNLEYQALKQIDRVITRAEAFFEESMGSCYIPTRSADNVKRRNAPYGVTLKAELVLPDGTYQRLRPGKMPVNYHGKFLNQKDRSKAVSEYATSKGYTQDVAGDWFFTDSDGQKYHLRESNFNIEDNKGIARQSKADIDNAITNLMATGNLMQSGTSQDVLHTQLKGVRAKLADAEQTLLTNANNYEPDEFAELLENIDEGLSAVDGLIASEDISNVGDVLRDLNMRIHHTSSGSNGLGLTTLRHTNADGWDKSLSGKPYEADDFLQAFNTQIENQVGAFQKQAGLKAAHEGIGELQFEGLVNTLTGQSLLDFKADILKQSGSSHWAVDVAQFITGAASMFMIGYNTATMVKNFNSNLFYHAMANQDVYGGTKAYRIGYDYITNMYKDRATMLEALRGNTKTDLAFYNLSKNFLFDFASTEKSIKDAASAWSEINVKAEIKNRLVLRGTISESIMSDLSRTPSDSKIVNYAQKLEKHSHTPNRIPDVITRTTMMNQLIDVELSKMNIDYKDPDAVEQAIKDASNAISARIDASFGKFSPLFKSDLERKALNFGGGALKPFMLYTGPAAVATHLWLDQYDKVFTQFRKAGTLKDKEGLKRLGNVVALMALGGFMGGTTFLQGINDAYNIGEVFKGWENDQEKMIPESLDANFVTKIENDVRATLMQNWGMTADQADRSLIMIRKGVPSAVLNRNVAQEESFLQTLSPVMGQVMSQTYDVIQRRDGGFAAAGEKFILKGVWKNTTTAVQNILRGGTEYKDVEIDNGGYDLLDFTAEIFVGPELTKTTGRTEDWRRNVALSGSANRQKFARTFIVNGGFSINSTLPKDKLAATKEMAELSPLLYNEFAEAINDPKLQAGMEYSTRLLDNLMDNSQYELGVILGKGDYLEENQSDHVNRQVQGLKRSMSKTYLEIASGKAWEKVKQTEQGKKFLKKYNVTQNNTNITLTQQLITAQNVLNNVYQGDRGKLSRLTNDERNYGKIALVAGLAKKANTPEKITALRKLAYRLFEFTD